ncbi:MAG: autotransporter-associated beta strand repeat-containing protein [Spartobacteria bacterium]
MAFLLVAVETMSAGSATWSANPVSTDWSVAGNWTPATVPNRPADVATFGASALPQVELLGNHDGTFLTEMVSRVTFSPGASAYTITAHSLGAVEFDGAGVINLSGIPQNFKTVTEDGTVGVGQFFFSGTSSAGSELNIFTNGEAVSNGDTGGECQFNASSTAGNAMFVNEGGSRFNAAGGEVNFYFSSTAGNATIINHGATAQGLTGGKVYFDAPATAGESVIVNDGAENTGSGGRILFFGGDAGSAQIANNGGTVSGAGGGTVDFTSLSGAGTATIINNGGIVAGAQGGVLTFVDFADAKQAILIANGGTNGGDGSQIVFGEAATASQAQLKIYGNGSLDLSARVRPGLRAGSLEGDGLVFLGGQKLALGFNNRSTTFSGTIMDGGIVNGVGGSLLKLGRGSLALSGLNTYTGGTIVKSGTLRVTNTTGSGTGTGPVTVEGGILAGSGVMSGAVTMGVSSDSFATIAPSNGKGRSSLLTTQGSLTFHSFSGYKWTVRNDQATADELAANGVTIDAGAVFSGSALGNGSLSPGTVFTALNNTSAQPISGTFDNLADGAVITVNGTNLQADYEGGDGNDLTLIVVP